MPSSLFSTPSDQNGVILTDNGRKILDSVMLIKNSGRDPKQVIDMLQSMNPNLSNLLNGANGNYKEIAEKMAKERGVNLDDLVKAIQDYTSNKTNNSSTI